MLFSVTQKEVDYVIIMQMDMLLGGLMMTNTEAWDYAIGMIKVDGLEPTEEFKKYIEKEKAGEVTMEDMKLFLDKKYKMKELQNA